MISLEVRHAGRDATHTCAISAASCRSPPCRTLPTIAMIRRSVGPTAPSVYCDGRHREVALARAIGGQSSPRTFVQVRAEHGHGAAGHRGSAAVAAALSAVLLAATEQVSGEKLRTFGVSSRVDLPLLGLAMAFNSSDNGLVGDVFEWSLLLAINRGDSGITNLLSDALALSGVRVHAPQAILVAAEGGRLMEYSPQLSPDATLATGRRGRPPKVTNLLSGATTTTWKADLLVGEGDRWVPASLKSSPATLLPSMNIAAATRYPPRIGITAVNAHSSGVVRDSESGVVVVKVPVQSFTMQMASQVLSEVQVAFERHLSLPSTPLRRGQLGVDVYLHARRQWHVGDVLEQLMTAAADELQFFSVGEVMSTGVSSEVEAHASMVSIDAITEGTLPQRREFPSRYLPPLGF